jgi:hypothetical protein
VIEVFKLRVILKMKAAKRLVSAELSDWKQKKAGEGI